MSDNQETVVEESQHQPSDSQEVSTQETSQEDSGANESLDDKIAKEQEEISEVDKADKEAHEKETSEAKEESEEEEAEEAYKPSAKYKVLDEEHEFDPKLKAVLNEETEPIIRELYEKAHGIDAIKASRAQVSKERDELRGNFQNLTSEVSRVMGYRRAKDYQSLFESLQVPDEEVAKYILEKARISTLPPEQQAVYNEREAFRKRMNAMEQNFQNIQAQGQTQEVQARINELDQTLGDEKLKALAKDFDSRNGAGSFKTAIINHGATQYGITNKDLSPKEAVDSFIKMTGLSIPKGQPKPGANDPTKRVVAKPKAKTIPSFGGGQASVTAMKKPTSIDDLRKLAKGRSL